MRRIVGEFSFSNQFKQISNCRLEFYMHDTSSVHSVVCICCFVKLRLMPMELHMIDGVSQNKTTDTKNLGLSNKVQTVD